MTCFYMEAKNVYVCDQCEAKNSCGIRTALNVATTRINTLVADNRLLTDEKDRAIKEAHDMFVAQGIVSVQEKEIQRWKGNYARMQDEWINVKMEVEKLKKEATSMMEIFTELVDKMFASMGRKKNFPQPPVTKTEDAPPSELKNIRIQCDRCGKEVDGMTDGKCNTAGFYRLQGVWMPFAKGEEKAICDECMWADPEYKFIYGTQKVKRPLANNPW